MKELKRLHILYAEDDEDAGFMLSTLLGFADIDVSLARSVKKAFEDAQTECFDAYLLKSRFSDGSGSKLCRRLHEFNPQTPIVFYSADAHQTDKQKPLSAGAKAYLVKPEINTVVPTILRLTSLL
jgi:DNA-binding response OmpR family regulator